MFTATYMFKNMLEFAKKNNLSEIPYSKNERVQSDRISLTMDAKIKTF